MKNHILIFFCLLLSGCFQSKSKLEYKQEFKKVYQDYLSSYSQREIDELQLIEKIESFKVNSINGKKITFGKNSSKPSVVIFFATWCPACKIALPKIDSAFSNRTNINLVAIGREHSKDELLKWQEKSDIGIDIIADSENHIYSQFANKFIPRFYVIDQDGNVLFQEYGWGDNFPDLIKMALKGA